MNQILYTGKNSGPISLKSKIKVFSICLIALGVLFIGNGSYALYRNYNLNKEIEENTPAEISFSQEGNTAFVMAEHRNGISKVKYYWNTAAEDEEIIQGSSFQTDILPGKNILHVTAIDEKGKSTERSYEYSYDGIYIDMDTISYVGNSAYIKVQAIDVKGISNLTYQWNSDEEVKAYPDSNDNTTIEQLIEIPLGLNTLKVTAINENNEAESKSRQVNGNRPPNIEVFVDGDQLYIHVTDEVAISEVKVQINSGDEITEQLNNVPEYNKTYTLSDPQHTLVVVTAIDNEGKGRTFKAKNY